MLTDCLGPWKHLRNVEHMLRDVPATSDAPAAGRGAAGLSSVTEAEYAPDFDHPLVPMTGLHPHPILPALARPAPLFAVISPTCTGPQLVNKINANNAASETGLAALWEAVGRQQFAHDSFKAEARRELVELKSALSAASLVSDSVAHERDILHQESEEKSAEIERLRSQVLALQASLDTAQRPRPSPVVVAHVAGAGDTQPILVDPPKTTALARTLPPLASERPDAHRTEHSDAAGRIRPCGRLRIPFLPDRGCYCCHTARARRATSRLSGGRSSVAQRSAPVGGPRRAEMQESG